MFALLVLGFLGVHGRTAAADIEFVTQELPWAVIDRPYSIAPLRTRSSYSCPLGGVGYSVIGGLLPPGIEMSKLGYFSGSPLRTGVFGFAIRVSNGCTWTAKRFTLTVTGAPLISVTPEKLVFDGAGTKLLRISATWPRLPYGVTADADWVKIYPAHGFTPRETSALVADEVTIGADTASLKPGRYSAKLTVAAWQALEAPTVTVEVNVKERFAPTESPTNVSRP